MPMFPSYRDFVRLERKIDDALSRIESLAYAVSITLERTRLMPKTLKDVEDQNALILDALRKNTDLDDSLKTLVNGVRSQVDDLTKQLADLKAAGGASPDDLQALFDQGQAMITSIDADQLSKAAIANTEADPNPAPAAPAPDGSTAAP